MTDEHQSGRGLPSPAPSPPSRTPAEAQFPYLTTHGLQSPASSSPSLDRPRPRPHRRTWLPLAIAGALFTLAVIAVDLTLGPRPFLGPHPDVAATQAVRGYLESLAEGDAATALGYALHAPTDAGLLTDRMLTEQRTSAPISDIEVSAPTDPGRVPANYLLGTERVEVVFELTLVDDAWRLDRVAAPADLSGFAVPVALNGMTAGSTRPALFPGHYRVTSDSPRYEVVGGGFTVRHPFEQPVVEGSLDLSETGRAEVIDAAETQLADCLSRHDLEPADCGFSLVHPEETPLDESTVQWRAHDEVDFTDLDLTLDHAGSASADIDLTIHGDARGLDGSRWKAHAQLTRLRADLTGPVVRVQFG